MKPKIMFFVIFGLCSIYCIKAQTVDDYSMNTCRIAIKTNLVYDLVSTINLGFEVKANDCVSFDISGNFNRWNTYDNNRIRHYMIQPELRYWFREVMQKGFFLAGHAQFGEFSAKLNDIMGLSQKDKYEGYLIGVGVGVGYRWLLTRHLHMEAEVGYGFDRIEYSRYHQNKPTCIKLAESRVVNRWLPTKLALNLIYEIK